MGWKKKKKKTCTEFLARGVRRSTIKCTTFKIRPLCVHNTRHSAVTPTGYVTPPSIDVEDGLIWGRRVIRRHLAHTATDSCNQQKKEEGDSRGQLVSSDKALCVTSDWVGILRRCTVMIGISASVLFEDLCLFVFMRASVRAMDWRERKRDVRVFVQVKNSGW